MNTICFNCGIEFNSEEEFSIVKDGKRSDFEERVLKPKKEVCKECEEDAEEGCEVCSNTTPRLEEKVK